MRLRLIRRLPYNILHMGLDCGLGRSATGALMVRLRPERFPARLHRFPLAGVFSIDPDGNLREGSVAMTMSASAIGYKGTRQWWKDTEISLSRGRTQSGVRIQRTEAHQWRKDTKVFIRI